MARNETDKQEFDQLPSPQDFCLTTPIYEGFRYNADESNPFFELEHFKGSLDCYCHGCERHTVFNRMGEPKYREHHHRRNTSLYSGSPVHGIKIITLVSYSTLMAASFKRLGSTRR